jgi:hypothetical protein
VNDCNLINRACNYGSAEIAACLNYYSGNKNLKRSNIKISLGEYDVNCFSVFQNSNMLNCSFWRRHIALCIF